MYEPGFSDGPGVQGIWLLPATSETGWRETTRGSDPVSVHDLERGVERAVGDEVEDRPGAGRVAARADRGEPCPVADERLARVADAEVPDAARRAAGAGNAGAREDGDSREHAPNQGPPRQAACRRRHGDSEALRAARRHGDSEPNVTL